MMILARPSISPYLARTLFELGEPVVLSEEFPVAMRPALNLLASDEVLQNPRAAYQSRILTSSENALQFLYEAIPHDDRVLKARIFKDKAAFRRSIRKLFPEFFFREFSLSELDSVDPSSFPFPLVLKPSVGISSIGVYRVASRDDWKNAVEFLKTDLAKYQTNYADAVVESGKIIIEEWIDGVELAIDGYFNTDAEPVILNILQHLFAGPEDTSDRCYFTHRALIRKYYSSLQSFLKRFGDIFDLKRFPFHLEVRCTPDGRILPIEVNPLRFAGLGTTELAEYAYGINVYRAFFREEKPDWDKLLEGKDPSIYSFMCADVPTELFRKPGLRIHDREFFKQFEEILDYRILSETETSTFAVIFYRSRDLSENERLIRLELSPYFSISG